MRGEVLILCAITLGFVKGLTIDNQLTIIRNDCYERLAIGERLNPKDVDKAVMLSTVQDCQMACTQEQDKCRSFSFGVGVKGNATCELSNHVIKETPDLKPIGTVSDVDYDLYIKKLGCKLVINTEPGNSSIHSQKPTPYGYDTPQDKPNYPSKPNDGYAGAAPSNIRYNSYNRPSHGQSSNYPQSSSSSYDSDKPFKVQSSLISIASNPTQPSQPPPPSVDRPNSYGTSGYGIGKPYYPNRFDRPDFDRPYGDSDDRPPFRPSALNHPYNYHYKPGFYPERPPFLPERFPSHDRLDFGGGYGQSSRPGRPNNIPDRPIELDDRPGYPSRPDPPNFLPPPNSDVYGSRPSRPDIIPERPLDNDYRPRPIRPQRLPERPLDNFDKYDQGSRPHRPHDVPQRPPSGYGVSGSLRPDAVPERPLYESHDYRPLPSRPERPFDGYDQGPRPHRPFDIPERPPNGEYGSKPHQPTKIPERPLPNDQIYESRPQRPQDVPDRPFNGEYGPKPHLPDKIPDRPRPDSQYGPKPSRPNDIPERPSSNFDNYGPASRPPRPNDLPERPFDGGYSSKPHRPDVVPERPFDDRYGFKPHRPDIIPERPFGDRYGSKPHRPDIIPERPFDDRYGTRPHRPDSIPERPSDDHPIDNYRPRPFRPHDIPERPLEDFYRPAPLRPHDIPERPFDDRYESRPQRPGLIPERPLNDDYRPIPVRPYDIPERPLEDFNNYGPGYRRRYDIPDSFGDRYDKYGFGPHRPEGPSDGYGAGLRPFRPHGIPERPLDYPDKYDFRDEYWSRPLSPYKYPPDYRGDYQYYKPVVYDTGFKRPVYVPMRHSYSNNSNYGYGNNPTEGVNETKNDLGSKGSNSSASNNTESQSPNSPSKDKPSRKPIVTQVVGPYGQIITSIITEISRACFRRVLAGKRVIRSLVRRTVACERVEDCQRECSDERRFVCEGFNYRLDPSGRAQGDCELLDLPLSRLDMRRDVYDDPDYDYYERDRNSDAPDCKGHRYYGSYGSSNHYYDDNRNSYYNEHRRGDYYGGSYGNDKYGHGYNREPRPDGYDYDYRYYDSNRRGGYDYHHTYQTQDDYEDSKDYNYKYYYSGSSDRDYDHYDHGHHYQRPGLAPPKDTYDYKPQYPPPPYDYKSYEPYLPHGHWKYERPFYDSNNHWDKYFDDRIKDKNYWGFRKHQGGWGSYGGSYGNFGAPDSYYAYDYYDNNHRNNNRHDYNDQKYYYVPNHYGGSKDWGRYGGSYGYGGQRRVSYKDGYNYWGFNQLDHKHGDYGNGNAGLLPPYQEKPEYGGNYLPPYDEGYDHFGIQHHDHHHSHGHHEHHSHDYDEFLKDECSLRMVTGFRLHKGIVKKLITVTNIYECELLCHKEADFPCTSYAFRYTLIPNLPSENCYLSDRHYKELDYYTDLEPDRDCDIYTINNKDSCDEPPNPRDDDSECFWRVRSGQRLDQKIVRDSLNVKSIVDCQLECLRSYRFTCRAFSFRYGSPVIGGAIDNCQLTDWPYLDLDPRIHLIPESGFEFYERGSYGHGCEPNHFEIGQKPNHNAHDKLDKMCYIGYGSPARLLPQATKKSLRVDTEADCKAECTRARDKSLFQCMSLSFRTSAPKGSPNCDLSDIIQRDLLSNVDYIADTDSWLFAWDVHNPRCVAVLVLGIGGSGGAGGGVIGGGGGGSGDWNGHHDHGHHDHDIHDHGNHDHGQHNKEGGGVIPWFGPVYPLDTWRIYSVGGLPCKRGSLCQENKVAGFWYCELEAREEHAWDYCCRPDHQCGYSEGFPYQWCYVGPVKTQWRKCNDRYYPYTSSVVDRYDTPHSGNYLPNSGHANVQFTNSIGSNHVPDQPYKRPSLRPPAPLQPPPPSLDDYDGQFNNYYLDPPRPGGFGQSRHWPISYLHKEMPPNDTSSDPKFDFLKLPKGRNIDSKYEAIANLIDVIKSNDLKNLQYQISNNSDKSDDVLYVKIPLPMNYSYDQKSEKLSKGNDKENIEKLEAVDLLFPNESKVNNTNPTTPRSDKVLGNNTTERKSHVYTRSYITKTNRTASNRQHVKNSKGTVELLPVS